MAAVHLHLTLTHVPIVGTLIGVLILAYGFLSKNDAIKKVALTLFVLMGITTVPVYFSGQGSVVNLEGMVGFPEDLIKNHHALAKKAFMLVGLLAVLSSVSLFALIKKKSFAKTVTLITFVVSIASFSLFLQVGSLGGQIGHSEIRVDNAG